VCRIHCNHNILWRKFSNIIKKSKISADVQLCRNLNTVLANAAAEGRIPGSVYDVLYLENEAGYIIENLNPTAEDMYFAWDQEKNQMIYIMSDLSSVYYPDDYNLIPANCWITVGSAKEAQKVVDKGYNIALEKDIDEPIVLNNVVSINTLGFKCGDVTMNSGDKDVATAYLIGNFKDAKISAGATNIVTSGVATSLQVTGTSATSVTVGGYVNSYSATGSGIKSEVASTGMVNNVTAAASIVNNGVVINQGSSSLEGNGNTGSATGNVVKASSKEDLDSIRTQVASGARTFDGETVKLSKDINLNGIASTPIANVSRDGITAESTSVFKGTFDGQGYAIQNFSTQGFTIAGLNAGTNSSTPYFDQTKIKYNEAVYGLIGVTYNATIKNLNITCSINMELDHQNHYVGDSVGGIVGCAYGTITFENCSVSGTIKGYDGVGGFLGRLKGTEATFINCTNNAEVIGVRKTGGFIGSSYDTAGAKVTYDNCTNNGNITCLGIERDVELECWNSGGTDMLTLNLSSNGSGYYTASASNGEFLSADGKWATIVGTFTNNGKIMIGSQDVGNGTIHSKVKKS